jgi:1,6-anhydro-N-acetylmuramate kinase
LPILAGEKNSQTGRTDLRGSVHLLEKAVEGLSTLPADVSTDQLDAIAAAYAAWVYATGQALSIPRHPGDEGAIWMPNPGEPAPT